MNEPINLIHLVESFQEVVNRHDVDEILKRFAEDGEFEIVGQSKLTGRREIRNIFEQDAGVNTKLEFINFRSEGDEVHCQILEQNDRPDAIGIRELKYDSCVFVFTDGLIQSFSAVIPTESMHHIMQIWQKFLPWIRKNYPDEYSRMFTSEGRFIYNLENGRDVFPLLKEWRSFKKNQKKQLLSVYISFSLNNVYGALICMRHAETTDLRSRDLIFVSGALTVMTRCRKPTGAGVETTQMMVQPRGAHYQWFSQTKTFVFDSVLYHGILVVGIMDGYSL